MKIALCLHGYFDTISTDSKGAGEKAYRYLNDILLSKYPVDTYFHCWQPEYEKRLKALYNPAAHIVEPQMDFRPVIEDNGLSQEYFDEAFDRDSTIYKRATIFNTLSFLYSRKRSIELCSSGEYDWVITSRFDIGQRGGVEVNRLKFDPSMGNSFLYSAYWDQLNAGYGDMWFYGSKINMLTLAKVYDKSLCYFKPHSRYEETLTAGWPDSRMYDVYDTEDAGQYTNEVLKHAQDRCRDLMKYPKWQCINNHLLYKWFCIESGLYAKSKWIK